MGKNKPYYNPNRNSMSHYGTKGAKWGYSDGKRNGKRTADEEEKISKDEKIVVKNVESDNPFSRTIRQTTSGSGSTLTTITKERGFLDRFVSNVQKEFDKQIKKGRNWLDELMGKPKRKAKETILPR